MTLNNQATLSGYVYSANAKGSNEAINLGSASYVFGALSGENIRFRYRLKGELRCASVSGSELADE